MSPREYDYRGTAPQHDQEAGEPAEKEADAQSEKVEGPLTDWASKQGNQAVSGMMEAGGAKDQQARPAEPEAQVPTGEVEPSAGGPQIEGPGGTPAGAADQQAVPTGEIEPTGGGGGGEVAPEAAGGTAAEAAGGATAGGAEAAGATASDSAGAAASEAAGATASEAAGATAGDVADAAASSPGGPEAAGATASDYGRAL